METITIEEKKYQVFNQKCCNLTVTEYKPVLSHEEQEQYDEEIKDACIRILKEYHHLE